MNRNPFFLLCLWLATAISFSNPVTAQVISGRTQAHAHNDYLHERPLLDALDSGFGSVEADIFLVDGQLLVAHTAKEIVPGNTLQKLYLDPLRERVKTNGGRVYGATSPAQQPFWLLIDIKTDANSTYRQLHDVLASYAEMLTVVEGDKVTPGAIQVVISGSRPIDYISAQEKRFCGLDGRLSDLDSSAPAHLMPMISDNWSLQFFWYGFGPVPKSVREKLHDVVERSHEKGRVVRFWATPENENLWNELIAANVDWINTDKLPELNRFLNAPRSEQLLTKVAFQVNEHPAFVIAARQPASGNPWVWYAPTMGAHLPGTDHHWYFNRFLDAGISIAGIDLGEVRGSPASNKEFLAFHDHMVQLGYSAKPVLLGQSRGGLMMLSFAKSYPEKLSAFAGIYPVCNLSSWPLTNDRTSTLADYGMSAAELTNNLAQFNPIDNLQGLVSNQVPMFSVHGDSDVVVPLEDNSGLLKSRYEALGGTISVQVIKGEGHRVSKSFFESQELVDFVMRQKGK